VENHLGMKALKEKVAKLESEIGDRVAEIDADHRDRDAAIAQAEAVIEAAKQEHERLKQEQQACYAAAVRVEEKGRALIASGEKEVTKSRRMSDEAKAMNLGVDAIQQAKEAFILTRSVWSGKLSSLQDGQTRRKTSELGKLKRRLAQKEDDAARTPDQYGTKERREAEAKRREEKEEAERKEREEGSKVAVQRA